MSTVRLSLPFVDAQELNFWQRISYWLNSHDLAMDLGTANTLIYLRHHGIVLNEPSIVAIDESTGRVVAIGHAAKEMYGKTSQAIRCVRPMKDGVIADFEMTTRMINFMLSRVKAHGWFRRPRVVIGVPSGITQVEKRAVIDAATGSGAGEVMLVEEPMAAAIGAGLPINRSIGNMIVDIGGGTTEVAILSMGGTLYSQSIRVAGDEMDEAIQRQMKRELGLQVGIFEAERIKVVIGSALPSGFARKMKVYGRDVYSGVPQQIEIEEDFVREALQEPINAIIGSIAAAIEQTSAEVSQDIMARGIHLAGGGALLRGLAERLHRETGIRFQRTADPLSCVVRGVGAVVENLTEMRRLCIA